MKAMLNLCLVAASLALASCVFIVSADDAAWEDAATSHTVNRNIRLPAHSQAEEVASVNGRIEIGPDSTLGRISSVNGSVRVGPRSRLDSIESVNGDIELAEGARLSEDLQSVNGPVLLQRGVSVGGAVRLVNGRLRAEQAEIRGAVETVSGDIELLYGSRVEQGLSVRSASQSDSQQPVRILLGEGVVVAGLSRFERPVQIYRHSSASLGDYHGDDVSILDWSQR